MDLSTSILGTTAVTYIRTRQAQAILTIGSDRFDRAGLASVGCFHFLAAARLSQILRDHFSIKSTRELFDKQPPEAFVLPQLGPVALAVLGAAFELKQLGGDAPLETWVKKHRKGHTITFTTLKHREAAERLKETKTRKARKAQRRNMAHRIRMDRLIDRAAAAAERDNT